MPGAEAGEQKRSSITAACEGVQQEIQGSDHLPGAKQHFNWKTLRHCILAQSNACATLAR